MARKVRSGDPDNIEAQAARRYWKALFGPGFSRDQDAAGQSEVGPAAKQTLTAIARLDLPGPLGLSRLSVQVQRFVHSLALSFETGTVALEFPRPPLRAVAAPEVSNT